MHDFKEKLNLVHLVSVNDQVSYFSLTSSTGNDERLHLTSSFLITPGSSDSIALMFNIIDTVRFPSTFTQQ